MTDEAHQQKRLPRGAFFVDAESLSRGVVPKEARQY